MIDPYLVALFKAAEDGEECFPVRMTLISGDRVRGTPVATREFVRSSFKSLVNFYSMRQPEVVKRAKRDQRQPLIEEEAGKAIAPFNVEIDTSGQEAITLANATVLFAGRDAGVELPVVRVQLSSVAVWWMAGTKEVKGSSSFFVGVTF